MEVLRLSRRHHGARSNRSGDVSALKTSCHELSESTICLRGARCLGSSVQPTSTAVVHDSALKPITYPYHRVRSKSASLLCAPELSGILVPRRLVRLIARVAASPSPPPTPTPSCRRAPDGGGSFAGLATKASPSVLEIVSRQQRPFYSL